jgi:hypothetical protein
VLFNTDRRLACLAGAITGFIPAIAAAEPQGTNASSEARPPLLLVEPDAHPTVTLRYSDADGDEIIHTGERPYAHDTARTRLGGNIDAFVAVGGTRLTKLAGHPEGAIVRVGFYKAEKNKPFFENISEDTVIEVELSGVRFNQPADVHAASIIQHLKYDRGDMEACGIPGDAREQFNTVHPEETLNDRVRSGVDARLGVLDGGDDPAAWSEDLGSAELTDNDDGAVTMTVRFEYPALRNLRDPWQSDLPGTFLEPIHFHLEFEALPQGVEPLDPARPRRDRPDSAD